MRRGARFIAYLVTLVLAAGCAGGGSRQSVVPGTAQMNRALTSLVTTTCTAKSPAVPAFFNDQCVSILLRPVPSGATLLAHNPNVNLIYEATGFIPVINEVQGPGFNPLWQVVDITFNPGVTPQQFTSEADILAATGITLMRTNTVLSIPVVGSTGK